MKKLNLLFLLVVLLLAFGCSEKDKPTDTNIYGYKLDQFINAETVRLHVDANANAELDLRGLFNYEIVSSIDGFSPRASVNAGYDLDWDTFIQGYLVPSDSHRIWFPTLDLPSAFKVRNTGLFRLYRKVVVDNGLRGSKHVELGGLDTYNMSNWTNDAEDAIKLSDLLQGIAAYDSVKLTAVDGYNKNYTPEQIADGYYFLSSEITTFPTFNDAMTNSLKKFRKLASITVYGATSDQNHSFALCHKDLADLVFQVPASFNGLERTIMTTTKY